MIAVVWKWVAAPDGSDDVRWAGTSDADEAALECALRIAGSGGHEVVVVTAGPPAAEVGLRRALAAGAHRAVRVDLPAGASSAVTAVALRPAVGAAAYVMAGDQSPDRGSGSVPAFLAAELGAAQALGLVELAAGDGDLVGMRRLDAGRRERLRVCAPAVVSVEGSVARLRRASLTGTIAAAAAPIEVIPGPPIVAAEQPDVVHPFRPRARVLASPQGTTAVDRIRALTHTATGAAAAGDPVDLDPPAAAARIARALGEWGYLG